MPWVALGGYTGLCPSLPYFAHVTAGYTIFCMKMDHPVGYGRVRGVRVFLLKTQTCVGLHCLLASTDCHGSEAIEWRAELPLSSTTGTLASKQGAWALVPMRLHHDTRSCMVCGRTCRDAYCRPADLLASPDLPVLSPLHTQQLDSPILIVSGPISLVTTTAEAAARLRLQFHTLVYFALLPLPRCLLLTGSALCSRGGCWVYNGGGCTKFLYSYCEFVQGIWSFGLYAYAGVYARKYGTCILSVLFSVFNMGLGHPQKCQFCAHYEYGWNHCRYLSNTYSLCMTRGVLSKYQNWGDLQTNLEARSCLFIFR